MSDTFPNAAPPPGALFDNVPSVTAVPQVPARKTSSDYTPCVAVWPSGRTQRANVKVIRLDTVDSARSKLASNIVAWVRECDVDAVTEAGSGADG